MHKHGYEIRAAHDGLKTIQMAELMNPDIILMDIHMAGFEAMRRLRADPRFVSTPIIELTALAIQATGNAAWRRAPMNA